MTVKATISRFIALPGLLIAVLPALNACTTADGSLGMRPPGNVSTAPATSLAATGSSPAPAAAPAMVGPAVADVQFFPVIGAPPEKVAELSSALAKNAAADRVAILPTTGKVAPYRLKGYFSAFDDGKQTVVIYVWDVIDPAGERIERIQGQEMLAGRAADPWSAVGHETLEKIAARTMQDFVTFATRKVG